MTLRLRLSLWYGMLCALALAVVGLVGYSVAVREQYLTLDRVLVVSARLVENGLVQYGKSFAVQADTTKPTRDGIVMVIRGYSPAGELMYMSASDPGLPGSKPITALLKPSPPAYQAVLPWPFLHTTVAARPNAAFGTIQLDQQRWRRYVVQVSKEQKVVAYVEALTPLGQLDAASLKLGRLLLNSAMLSVVAVVLIGWMMAGQALRPVNRLNRAARGIAQSRDLTQRVRTSGSRDELDRLASTFNEMLTSLDAAWASQQRFVADASHELRAPLTVMRGNLELLRRHPQLDATERQAMLADIERETTRLSRLVDDLLLLARSDAGITLLKRPVNLYQVSLEAVRDARRLAPEHDITLQLHGEQFTVQADPDRLKQLLLILLDNAAKYSPTGSRIALTLQAQGGEVQVNVEDQGSGIDPEDLPHIFERFYRADPARMRTPGAGGAGLGLSIAQWIATQLGGTLSVQDTSPHGTTFSFQMPASLEGEGVRPTTPDAKVPA